MRLLPVAILLGASLLAGCYGDPGPAGDQPLPARPTALRGSARPPPDAPLDVVVAWTGSTGWTACLPAAAGPCQPASVPDPTRPTSDSYVVSGPPLAWNGTLVLTWTADSPLTQQMALTLHRFRSCGANCLEAVGNVTTAQGASPLTLAVELRDRAEAADEGLWIAVRPAAVASAPAAGYAAPPQPFHVDGALRGVPFPTPPSPVG